MCESEAVEPSLRAELKSWLVTKQSFSPSKPDILRSEDQSKPVNNQQSLVLEADLHLDTNQPIGNENPSPTSDIDMSDNDNSEPRIRTTAPVKSLAIEEGHVQEIITKSAKWNEPVTREELANAQTFTRLLRRFIDYEVIDVESAIERKNRVNELLSAEENLRAFREVFTSQDVEAKVFRRFDSYLERKLGLLPIIQKLNQAAAGAFVEAAENSYRERGVLVDRRARFIKKQIDDSVDVESPCSWIKGRPSRDLSSAQC